MRNCFCAICSFLSKAHQYSHAVPSADSDLVQAWAKVLAGSRQAWIGFECSIVLGVQVEMKEGFGGKIKEEIKRNKLQ